LTARPDQNFSAATRSAFAAAASLLSMAASSLAFASRTSSPILYGITLVIPVSQAGHPLFHGQTDDNADVALLDSSRQTSV